jgi:cell division protein FtsB
VFEKIDCQPVLRTWLTYKNLIIRILTNQLDIMLRRKKKISFPKSNFINKIKEKGIPKNRKIKVVLFLLVLTFLVYRFCAGPYGFFQIHSLKQEKKNLSHESCMLKAEIVDMEIEKNRLQNDPFYLEKQARERLGLIKEGEKVYRVVHKEKPSNTKALTNSPPDSASR